MASRDPIILLCDYHNDIGFQVTPDEFRRYLEKLGVDGLRIRLHQELELAIEAGLRLVGGETPDQPSRTPADIAYERILATQRLNAQIEALGLSPRNK